MAEKKLPKGISLRKDGLYMGRFKYQNETYTIYGKNVKKLEKELADLRYEVEHGLKGKADNMTLNAWFDVWLNDFKAKTVKESTMVRYTDQYNQYIKKELGIKRLAQIKPIIIQRHFNEMAARDYSTKTISDTYTILYNMFKIALQNNLIIRNPCEAVILPKTKEKERRVLSVEEQKELIQYSKGRSCENIVLVALYTGLRVGELHGLTWNDIDFENREIHINKTLVYIRNMETGKYYFKFQTPKTKKGVRKIPMLDEVYWTLKRQKLMLKQMQIHARNWNPELGFENLVFLNYSGKPRQGMDFRNDLQRVENAINKSRKKEAMEKGKEYVPFPHIHPHLCRHSFATRCFEAGMEVKTVQTFLGHASVAITLDLYTHVTESKAKQEMEKLEELYRSIG